MKEMRRIAMPVLPSLLLIPLALSLVSAPAGADWVAYQQNAETEELFESALVSREKSLIKVWTLTNYRLPITSLEGQALRSEKSLVTIDCATGKLGAEKVTKHADPNGQGTLVSTMETSLRMTSVRPDSADALLTHKLCR